MTLTEDYQLDRVEIHLAGGSGTVHVAQRILRSNEVISSQDRSASFQIADAQLEVQALLKKLISAARRAVGDDQAVIHLPGKVVTTIADRPVLE